MQTAGAFTQCLKGIFIPADRSRRVQFIMKTPVRKCFAPLQLFHVEHRAFAAPANRVE